MTASATEGQNSAEEAARSFLAALDEGRWNDAVALVHPRTREAFKTWWVGHLKRERPAPSSVDSETMFASSAELLGTADAAEAARLPAEALLARFAETVQPANLHRRLGESGEEPIRVVRTLLDSAPGEAGGVIVRYRCESWHGQLRNEATAAVCLVEMTRLDGRWYVRDADLGAGGIGHLVPRPTE